MQYPHYGVSAITNTATLKGSRMRVLLRLFAEWFSRQFRRFRETPLVTMDVAYADAISFQ